MRYPGMMDWPVVLNEDETLQLVLNGASISRFGDGEINLCFGGKCRTQCYTPELSKVLRNILKSSGDCLVGIPYFDKGPNQDFWKQYKRYHVRKLFTREQYVSAFITRPDSAPWIDRPDYWDKLRSLWFDRKVTLVRGSEKSLVKDLLIDARDVQEILVPLHNAFKYYDRIISQIDKTTDIVILCCGVTATIMAHDLCQRGRWAVDLGHIGMFLKKHIKGEPMVVTEVDKAVDREVA